MIRVYQWKQQSFPIHITGECPTPFSLNFTLRITTSSWFKHTKWGLSNVHGLPQSLCFFISGNNCAQGQCLNDQRTLLLQLNQSLNSSSFSSKHSSWGPNTDCCSSSQGIKCDTSGHFISLDPGGEDIIGGLDDSSSLFNFQYLERLNLANNSFSRYTDTPSPSGLSKLVKLNYLNQGTVYKSGNSFTGHLMSFSSDLHLRWNG